MMLEVFEDIEEEEQDEVSLPKEYGIDFKTGLLSGEIVEGAEALKVWCYFALRIARYRYRAFTWAYGSEAEDMIGKCYGRDYTESEIKRMVSDCVCCHPNIDSCEDMTVQFEGSKISVSFSIVTDFGNEKTEFELVGD